MAADVVSSQRKYKALFQNEFKKLMESESFKKIFSMFPSLKSLNFEIISTKKKEIDKVVKLVSMSHAHNIDNVFAIFDLSEKELEKMFYPTFKHYAECLSRCIVCKLNDKVIGFEANFDILDSLNPNNANTAYTPKHWQHRSEIDDAPYNDFILKYKKTAKYGEYLYGKFLTIHPSFRNSGLSLILQYMGHSMASRLGYKYLIGTPTNRKTQKIIYDESKVYDLSSFKFKDSTDIKYYFDKFQKQYNYNKQQMMNIKTNCKMMAIKTRIIDPENKFIYAQFAKMIKTYKQKNSKQKPKL
eukprot:338077_1